MTFALLGALALCACRGGESAQRGPAQPATQAPARPAAQDAAPEPGREGAACASDERCGFGLVCTSQRCAPSPCHDGDPMTPPRICPDGQVCSFESREAMRAGRGTCAPLPGSDASARGRDAG